MKRTVFSRVIRAVTALLLLPAGCWRTEPPLPSPAPVPSKAVGSAADNATAPSAALRRVHVFVSGRVQGVGFRAFTEEHARTLGLAGTVKNLADGRVEAIVEGPADKVAQLLTLLKKGPSLAEVENVEATDETPTKEFQDFKVLY